MVRKAPVVLWSLSTGVDNAVEMYSQQARPGRCTIAPLFLAIDQVMPFKKGQSGNPAGRKPGQVTAYSALTMKERLALVHRYGTQPLHFLMSVMVDDSENLDRRIDSAKALLPYMHRKMPTLVEVATPGEGGLDYNALMRLPSAERATLLALLAKAQAIADSSPIGDSPPLLAGEVVEADDESGYEQREAAMALARRKG